MTGSSEAAQRAAAKTLVTGGVRSGKSAVAERLLSDAAAVTYVACGPPADSDPEWAARVAMHQARRGAGWQTVESTDLPAVLGCAGNPVLVDCLGTWLTAQLDDLQAWEREQATWGPTLDARIEAMAAAIDRCPQRVVVVTNEVGWSLVSEHRSGRLFTDRLGWLNQTVAAVCADVQLVVAGRVITL